MIEVKLCETCGHYTLQGIKYTNTNCGKCIRKNTKIRLPNESCEFWTDAKVKKRIRKQSIIEKLEKMSENLEQIKIYLENESD